MGRATTRAALTEPSSDGFDGQWEMVSGGGTLEIKGSEWRHPAMGIADLFKSDGPATHEVQYRYHRGAICAYRIMKTSDGQWLILEPTDATQSMDFCPSGTLPRIGSGDGDEVGTPSEVYAFVPATILPQCTRDHCVDRARFMQRFGVFYRSKKRKALNASQIDALNTLLNVWDTTTGLVGKRRLAYVIATVFHETTNNIYPTRECSCRTDEGSVACAKRLYDKGIASGYFRRDKTTNQSYYGRGQTQLTLKENYNRVGHKLLQKDRLTSQPDDALSLPISSQNAVLGLYYGWYRAPNNRWLGLRDIAFNKESDWIRARDVLIAKRRHASWVAGFAKDIVKAIQFIPQAEFAEKYTAKAGDDETVDAAPYYETQEEATGSVSSDSAAAGENDVAENSAGGQIGRSLGRAAGPIAQQRQASHGIDFQTTWPPAHKESSWCSVSKSLRHLPLAADDPVVLRYGPIE